jgi:CHASE3 domain sensor protein
MILKAFMDMPVKAKASTIFSAIGAIVITAFSLVVWKTFAIYDTYHRVEEMVEFTEDTLGIEAAFLELRVQTLRYSETGDPAFLQAAESEARGVTQAVAEVRSMTTNENKIARLAEIEKLASDYIGVVVLAASDEAQRAERNRLGGSVEPLIEALVTAADEQEAAANAALEEDIVLLRTVALGAMGLLAVVLIGAAIALARTVSAPIARTTAQMEEVAKGDLSVRAVCVQSASYPQLVK